MLVQSVTSRQADVKSMGTGFFFASWPTDLQPVGRYQISNGIAHILVNFNHQDWWPKIKLSMVSVSIV